MKSPNKGEYLIVAILGYEGYDKVILTTELGKHDCDVIYVNKVYVFLELSNPIKHTRFFI